jgi:hypothetical protein
LDLSVKKLAVGAVRLAAMSQLGPLAGGLSFARDAVSAKTFEKSEFGEMLADLGLDAAGEFFKCPARRA